MKKKEGKNETINKNNSSEVSCSAPREGKNVLNANVNTHPHNTHSNQCLRSDEHLNQLKGTVNNRNNIRWWTKIEMKIRTEARRRRKNYAQFSLKWIHLHLAHNSLSTCLQSAKVVVWIQSAISIFVINK